MKKLEFENWAKKNNWLYKGERRGQLGGEEIHLCDVWLTPSGDTIDVFEHKNGEVTIEKSI